MGPDSSSRKAAFTRLNSDFLDPTASRKVLGGLAEALYVNHGWAQLGGCLEPFAECIARGGHLHGGLHCDDSLRSRLATRAGQGEARCPNVSRKFHMFQSMANPKPRIAVLARPVGPQKLTCGSSHCLKGTINPS